MNGYVYEAGRALLHLSVRASAADEPREISVWVDTAFDGELAVSISTIRELGLAQSGALRATLADGRDVMLESFNCCIDWFGASRSVEVIANEGRLPLLGIGLLMDRKLVIDYVNKSLQLE